MRNKKGFTLAELLIVVLIIAILSVVVIVSYDKARKSSRDSKRKEDIANIASSIRMYYLQKEYYPANVNDTLPCNFGGTSTSTSDPSKDWGGDGCLGGLLTDLVQTLPADPKNANDSTYPPYSYRGDNSIVTTTNPKDFAIVRTVLENTTSVPGSFRGTGISGDDPLNMCTDDYTYCIKLVP